MSIILDGTSGINTPNTFAYKNLLIDAGFTINQRGYVSAATLASGAYGHDRWKAGASGGDYSFTQLASNTQITIASGKSLIQVVEDKNVSGTSYVLSWEGTAQARYAVNSATPAGSYAASPIVITGQTAGTTMSVEFNAGTLSKPQLELGAVATSFDVRPYGTELALCQRYYESTFSIGSAPVQNGGGTNVLRISQTAAAGAPCRGFTWIYKTTKRDTPSTITSYNPSAANANVRNFTRSNDATISGVTGINTIGITFSFTSSAGSAVGDDNGVGFSADAEL